MTSTANTAAVDVSLARRIDNICDRFERAIKSGGNPRMTEFLKDESQADEAGLIEQLRLLRDELAGSTQEACGANAKTPGPSVGSFEQKKIAGFSVSEVLGTGGFGTVYKAVDPRLDRTVALKVPHAGMMASPTHLERVLREARTAAQLDHASIVRVYEIIQDDDVPVIVSEFIEGSTLDDSLDRGDLALDDVVRLISQVASAVHYAHQQGVVHRDIKPANILVDERNQPHLADFGLARRPNVRETLTLEGQIVGTPAYMAPEQLAGHRGDARCDIYSLGVVLYQSLTGRLPFQGTTLPALIEQVHDAEPVRPRRLNPNISRELEAIVLKCLHKRPGQRYQTSGDLHDDLNRYLAGEPVTANVGSFGRLSNLLRDTRHSRLLASFARVMFTTGIMLFCNEMITQLMLWNGVASRAPYFLLWGAFQAAMYGTAFRLRRLTGSGSFLERQIVPIWTTAALLVWGVVLIEAALNLPVLRLAPILAVCIAAVFLVMARLFGGKLKLIVAAYILCASLMVWQPDFNMLIKAITDLVVFTGCGVAFSRYGATSELCPQTSEARISGNCR